MLYTRIETLLEQLSVMYDVMDENGTMHTVYV